jgi:hypothetical protein
MRRLVIVLTAVLAAVLTICGCDQHPLIPASAVANPRPAPPKLAAPLLGVDVYSETPYSVTETARQGRDILGYLHSGLHAQVAGLMWDLCSPSRHSEVVRQCAPNAGTNTGSMSPAAIATLAAIATRDGLKIAMRPIIRVGRPQQWNNAKVSWEGHIAPHNERQWFASLLAAERPYLKVARQFRAVQFVAGTELAGLKYSTSWPWFLSQAQALCGCQVSYSAQMDEFVENSPDLPPLKAPGTDFYPKLSLPPTASQAQVTTAWEASLAVIPKSKLQRTSLDEISIRATAGAYHNPANWNVNGADAPQVQARYFTAVCTAAARFHLRAIYFYFVPLNDSLASPINFPAYFVKNAGSRAIRGCRAILAHGAMR